MTENLIEETADIKTESDELDREPDKSDIILKDSYEFAVFIRELNRLREKQKDMIRICPCEYDDVDLNGNSTTKTCNFLMYVDETYSLKFSVVDEDNQKLYLENLPYTVLKDYLAFREAYERSVYNALQKTE